MHARVGESIDHEEPWQVGVGLGYLGTGQHGGRIC